MNLLPQFQGLTVEQRTLKAFRREYHRYYVEGYPCGTCEKCAPKPNKNGVTKKPGECIGLPSVTSISGQYGGGGLYPAGYKHALDAVFGEYNKAKTKVNDGGWMTDYLRPESNTANNAAFDMMRDELLRYRQEVEELPTPGTVAAEFGTGVHKAIESLLVGDGDAEIPAKYADAVSAVLSWLQRGGSDGPYIVEDTEVSVFHPELLIGGQIDCVVRCGNRVIIIDWKSGKDIYPNHAMQIAAYAMAYEAMTGEVVSEAWIVKSGRHGFDAKQVADLAPAQKAFIAMQETKKNVDAIEFITTI